MKYQVYTFYKGQYGHPFTITAKSHKQAAKITNETQVLVINEKGNCRRYYNGKFVKQEPRFFKTQRDWRYAILVLIDNLSELYYFDTKEERDEVFDLCTTSAPVESAKNNKEPSDITASFDETSASRSGSTWKKISNGFAPIATWLAKQTPFNTEENSGSNSVASSEPAGWSAGSNHSRSKQKRTFAIVKRSAGKANVPGRYFYKTVPVVLVSKDLYMFGGYAVKEDMLDFEHARLQVIPNIKTGVREMDAQAGQVKDLKKCSDHWTDGEYCWDERYLQLPAGVYKKGKIIGGEGYEMGISKRDIRESLGKVMLLLQSPKTSNWKMVRGKGYFLPPHWIDFDIDEAQQKETQKVLEIARAIKKAERRNFKYIAQLAGIVKKPNYFSDASS